MNANVVRNGAVMNEDEPGRKKMPKRSLAESESVSLSVDPGDKDLVCGACLSELFSPDHTHIGVPAGCPHLFHWTCLDNWAQLKNTCPQCNSRFRVAGQYTSNGREFVECFKFKKRDRVARESDNGPEEDVDVPVDLCEKCQAPGSEEELILCDGMDFTCNAMFHYKCVGFDSVPSGVWFCEGCISKGYIPDELKKMPKPTKKRREVPSPATATEPSSPDRSLPITRMVMAAPNLFPRQLIVHQAATRAGKVSSSKLPVNLVLDLGIVLPVNPAQSSQAAPSVFARFRERRLELKRKNANT